MDGDVHAPLSGYVFIHTSPLTLRSIASARPQTITSSTASSD